MIYTGKAQLTIVIDAPAELETDGDRFFEMHAAWIQRTHYREGDKVLLQYNVAKSYGEDGNEIFVLTEVYESAAGIDDYIEQAQNDEHHDLLVKLMEQSKVTFLREASIINSLWQGMIDTLRKSRLAAPDQLYIKTTYRLVS